MKDPPIRRELEKKEGEENDLGIHRAWCKEWRTTHKPLTPMGPEEKEGSDMILGGDEASSF